MLCDRIVCGICDKAVQRRLLQVSFNKALEIALSAEAAEKDSKRLTGGTYDKDLPAPVEQVRTAPPPGTKATANAGLTNHNKPHNNCSSRLLTTQGNRSVTVVEASTTPLIVSSNNTSVIIARKEDIWPRLADKRREMNLTLRVPIL